MIFNHGNAGRAFTSAEGHEAYEASSNKLREYDSKREKWFATIWSIGAQKFAAEK